MTKKNIMQIILIVVLAIVLCIIVRLFIDEKNTTITETNNNSMFSQSGGTFLNKPNGDMGQLGVDNNANVSHNGATEISSDTMNNLQTYSSTESSQNALLVTNGTSKISPNCSVPASFRWEQSMIIPKSCIASTNSTPFGVNFLCCSPQCGSPSPFG